MFIRKSIESFNPDEICSSSKNKFFLEFTPSSSGDELGLPLMFIKGNGPGKTLAIIAGIHGDEYEGTQAIHEIFNHLDAHEVSGNILLVPVANIRAHRVCGRISPDDHLNLARVFPGSKDGTITERIAF